jgi:hypothetical protein
MKAPVKKIFPNFAEGYNGKVDPTELPANAFSGKNWIPSAKFGGALEKVRSRRQDFLATGTGSQDDRLYTASNGAVYRYGSPHLDQIRDVYFFYNNLYSTTVAGTTATPTAFKMWHATPANMLVTFGIRLERPALISTARSLVVSVWLRRIGAYNANRHKLKFALGNTATTVETTFTKQISATEWTRVEIHFVSPSTDIGLSTDEYSVTIVDSSTSGADTNTHYEIALSDAAGDAFGYAVCTNNSGTTYQSLAECIVYQRQGTNANGTTQDAAAQSVEMGLRTVGNIRVDQLGYYGVGNQEAFKGLESYWFTDGFGVYRIGNMYHEFAETWDISDFNIWEGVNLNRGLNDSPYTAIGGSPAAALTVKGKFIGRIDGWCAYQRKLVMGGVGGIAVVDLSDMDIGTPDFGDIVIPDIGNRRNTTSTAWITTGGKDADVYPPVVSNVFVAGINPGRIFATIDDTIIWSGGTTAATAGTLTSWSAFATIQFGDTADHILKACWFKGYILLFTQNGDLYYFTGEPPVDPANGYGNLRADFLSRVGKCSSVTVGRDGVWFATDEGRQLWFMDHAFVPKRVDENLTESIKVSNIYWDELTDRVWVASERHVKRSYLTAVTTDNTLTDAYEDACSFMLDSGKWYRVQRSVDTDTTATKPTTFIFGPIGMKIGAYWEFKKTVGTYAAGITPSFTTGTIADMAVGDLFVDSDTLETAIITAVGASTITVALATSSGSFYTIKSTPYAYIDYADGFLGTYNSATNDADPDNSDNRASSVTADLYTQEVDFTEASGLLGAVGAIREAFFSGYLITGSTCTVYAVTQDGTETEIATITADASVSSPTSGVYRVIASAMERTGAVRLKISVAGKYKDVIRSAGFGAVVYGQKAVSS